MLYESIRSWDLYRVGERRAAMGKTRKVREFQLGSSSKGYYYILSTQLCCTCRTRVRHKHVASVSEWYLYAARRVICTNLSKEQSCAGLKMAMRCIRVSTHTCMTAEYQWRVD